jgi:hypothetical protein
MQTERAREKERGEKRKDRLGERFRFAQLLLSSWSMSILFCAEAKERVWNKNIMCNSIRFWFWFFKYCNNKCQRRRWQVRPVSVM